MGQQRRVEFTDQAEQTSAAVLAGCEPCEAARVGLLGVGGLAALVGAVSYPAVAAGMAMGLVLGASVRLRR